MIRTVASKDGIGAVLCQKRVSDESERRPIAFASRKLSPSEPKLSTIEKECLAIVGAIKRFSPYIYGYELILCSDHKPLRRLLSSRDKLDRLALFVNQYNILDINYTPGSENVVADALLRKINFSRHEKLFFARGARLYDNWMEELKAGNKMDEAEEDLEAMLAEILIGEESDEELKAGNKMEGQSNEW